MKLDPKKIYSARELMAHGVFGDTDMKTVTRCILEDKVTSKPVLNAEIRGEGKMRRYYILGACARAYLKKTTSK